MVFYPVSSSIRQYIDASMIWTTLQPDETLEAVAPFAQLIVLLLAVPLEQFHGFIHCLFDRSNW